MDTAALGGKNDHREVAAYLTEQDATVDAKTNDGSTPLHLAAQEDHKELAKLLLDKGADVEVKDENNGQASLHLAAERGHLEVLNLLLQRGACINARDRNNETPLSLAIRSSNYSIAKALLTFIDQAEQRLCKRVVKGSNDGKPSLLAEYYMEKEKKWEKDKWEALPDLITKKVADKIRPYLPTIFNSRSKKDNKTVLDLLMDNRKALESSDGKEKRQEIDEIIAMLNKYRREGHKLSVGPCTGQY
ncbi:MAG: ankyrin repeat domain-containing protein [Cytophagales bacterium]|nr:ankyrin repeat domain-containing protein [Cytophagales bacterium]